MRALTTIVLALSFFLAPGPEIRAQAATQQVNPVSAAQTAQKQNQRGPVAKAGTSTKVGWMSSFEMWLSLSVLLFGLIALMFEYQIIRHGAFRPDDSIKLVAVTLIVISTLFIITAGFDATQIAPAMGLFGTVAGYMLGKSTKEDER